MEEVADVTEWGGWFWRIGRIGGLRRIGMVRWI
jgi:hypothetical protein